MVARSSDELQASIMEGLATLNKGIQLEWYEHPMTAILRRGVEYMKALQVETFMNGGMASESFEDTAMNHAKAVGYLAAIAMFESLTVPEQEQPEEEIDDD